MADGIPVMVSFFLFWPAGQAELGRVDVMSSERFSQMLKRWEFTPVLLTNTRVKCVMGSGPNPRVVVLNAPQPAAT
jgi:hypothetical protein